MSKLSNISQQSVDDYGSCAEIYALVKSSEALSNLRHTKRMLESRIEDLENRIADEARIKASALRYAASLVQQNNLNFQCVDATVQQLEKKAEELWPNKTK